MKHGDKRLTGGFRWRCRIKDAENQKRLRLKRTAQGKCIVCMVEPTLLGFTYCRSCRARADIYSAKKTIEKYTYLLSLDHNDPEYIAIVQRKAKING